MLLVCEEDGLAPLDHVADRDVEKNDLGVRARDFGCEFTFDVIAIGAQLFGAVGKGKSGSPCCKMPCGRPFGSRADPPFRVRDSQANFCVSNASLSLFIN